MYISYSNHLPLKQSHFQEWLNSGVDPDIIALNVVSLEGQSVYDYLLTGNVPRRNNGRVRDHILKKLTHCEDGGWWCQGEGLWGQFKPDKSRKNQEGKTVKYEAPPRLEATLYKLRVSWRIGLKIARKNGYEQQYSERLLQAYEANQASRAATGKEEKADGSTTRTCRTGHSVRGTSPVGFGRLVSDHGRKGVLLPTQESAFADFIATEDAGFWDWVEQTPSIPITITEGAKKAGALLTAGYVTIALPGIWMGIRTPKDILGYKIGKTHLIPALERFAVAGRKFNFVFDQDTKPKTVQQVNKAIDATAWQLKQKGCEVRVTNWSSKLGKGVDDLIVGHGTEAFDRAYEQALNLENWKASCYSQLTYEPQTRLNRRFLGELNLPASARLVAIKSPKGTGKTEAIISVVAAAQDIGQKVLVITHRVQLGKALCDRFGMDYVTELKDSETRGVFGYGLCVDSLHPKSQARFNPEDWEDCLVIIDEVEQVVWHMLNSSTCQKNRVAILKNFKRVIQNAGRVIVADADLSDTSINYLVKLLDRAIEPYIVQNDWQPGEEHRWLISSYTDSTPASLVAQIENELQSGGKAFVLCSAQQAKSRWGTQVLEEYFKNRFPEKRISRIDSKSIADPNHPAYGCIDKLNDILGQYDLVLASPSIETGVSIDIKGHFTACFGIFQGVQAVNSACQMLARLRDPVPRYIWAAPHGIGKISKGELSISAIQASQYKLTSANVRLLINAGIEEFSSNPFQNESLECWGKMAVRINAGMVHYRDSLIEALKAEGHLIVEGDVADDAKDIKQEVTAAKETVYAAHCEAISSAGDITETVYESLKDQRAKTEVERHQQRKHELQKRYATDTVTPDLVKGDDDGLYPKLRLHYYLSLGKDHVTDRDKRAAAAQLEQGEGDLWQPDFNGSQLGLKTRGMNLLGIPALLDPDREFRNSDTDLQEFAKLAKSNPYQMKVVLGVTVKPDDTPIVIFQRCLAKLGLKLSYIKMEGTQGSRMRVYQLAGLADGRVELFQRWKERDIALSECVSKTTFVESVEQGVHRVEKVNANLPSVCTGTEDKEHIPSAYTNQDQEQDQQWTVGQIVKCVNTRIRNLAGLVGRIVGVESWSSNLIVDFEGWKGCSLSPDDFVLA